MRVRIYLFIGLASILSIVVGLIYFNSVSISLPIETPIGSAQVEVTPTPAADLPSYMTPLATAQTEATGAPYHPTITPSPITFYPKTPPPTPTPTPDPTPLVESTEWLCYIATAYNSDKPNPCGNRGELLTGRKAIAMWQSDTDYNKYYSMVEPFKSFLTNKELAAKYGALPYGTKVEMRVWNPATNKYDNWGIFEVLDDSPTTIYNLSDMAQHLSGPTGPLRFTFQWTNINYKGQPVKGGTYYGYCSNWKEEYSNRVIGWLDIWQGNGSMLIVEIRVVH